jgi:hypothetical protein
MENQQDETAKVIPINRDERAELWPVERINGIKVRLGAMSLDQLVVMARVCRAREEDARLERLILEDHIAARFDGEPEGL